MSFTHYTISFQPDEKQIAQLTVWMIAENQQRNGLTHDLSIITDHSRKNTLATISVDNEVIGFTTWTLSRQVSHIAVAAVAPTHRRSGIGRQLTEALFTHLQQNGIVALYLECAPAVSEKFWRKMGFQKMPKLPYHNNTETPRLYKIIVPVQESGKSKTPYLQIYEYGSTKKQRWPLTYKSGTNQLAQPIITPVGGDWCIEHVISTIPQWPDKIKNFKSGKYLNDPFLIITEL